VARSKNNLKKEKIMHPLKMKSIKAKRFTTIFWLALFISPIYLGIMSTGVASASKLGTDSVGTYTHPELGGPAEAASPTPGIKREGSGAKKPHPPVMKKEGSGGKKHYGMKKGHHGYSKKSEGSAGKKGYKKHHGMHHGKSHHGKRHGKYEGSKGKKHGYGHHGYSKGHGKGHGKGHHGRDPFSHILRYAGKLGLSEQQVAEIRKNRMAFMNISLRAEADHQIAHLEMESLIHSGVLDEGRMFELGGVILESKKQKIHAMITAKIAIMKILTPEQRTKISKIHQAHH
jgi:Spy/CpxP family protein refolding chaperone